VGTGPATASCAMTDIRNDPIAFRARNS
jgi:hypothetical protein